MAEFGAAEGPNGEKVCRVTEEQFPLLEKCVVMKNDGIFKGYHKLCPHCKILALPPDGGTLEMVVLFECSSCGYWKRVKND